MKIFWHIKQKSWQHDKSQITNHYMKTCLCIPSDGMSMRVLRTPVNITLRRFARGSDAVSASWNFSLVGGHGGWQSEGCHILGHHDNFTTISCNSLGNYGLLMVGWVLPYVCCLTQTSSAMCEVMLSQWSASVKRAYFMNLSFFKCKALKLQDCPSGGH